MTSVCYTPFKLPRVRVTKLDTCGIPVTGSCSKVVSDGIITVELTKEYEDRQEFFVKNGDGTFCVKETNPPILKWVNINATFCNVDPEMLNIVTGNPLVADNADTPRNTGYSEEENAVLNSNFALEGWSRISGSNVPCTGVNQTEYGYWLFPWVIEGTIGDITLQNDTVSFIYSGRTRSGSPWGTGPYTVDLSDATATLNNPIRLVTPIGSLQHYRMFLTRMAPPASACGCQALP